MTEKNKIKTAVIKCNLIKCLFKKIDKIKENETSIKKLLVNNIPFPPIINERSVYIKHITDNMVIDLLNSYIADGGKRTFKTILEPTSEVELTDITDSDSCENTGEYSREYSNDGDI